MKTGSAFGLLPRVWALLVLQPVLIATAQVFWLYSANVASIPKAQLLRPLMLICLVTITVWLLLRRWMGDGRRAALATSILAIAFWGWSSLEGALSAHAGASPEVARGTAALLFMLALPMTCGWIGLTSRPLGALHRIMDVAAPVGLAFPLVTILLATGPEALGAGTSTSGMDPSRAEATSELPDIYLIILDAYARDDELREHFGVVHPLGDRLRELGFYVADKSRANYPTTSHSLTSVLNYELIHNLTPNVTHAHLIAFMHDSRIVRWAKQTGYEFVAYSSGYPLTQLRAADRYIQPPPMLTVLGAEVRMSAFERGLLPWTPIDSLLRRSPKLSPYLQHRKRVLHHLEDIPRHGLNPKPTFVFLHVVSPHEPFVFGEHGEDVSPYDLRFQFNRIFADPDQPKQTNTVGPEYARRYRAQAVYIGELVTRAAKEILESSSQPPIVIILGDHGPYGFAPDVRQARFATLGAYHLPEVRPGVLSPTISPVNALRIVLNEYFGENLPLLPDKSFETSYSHPEKITPTLRD